MRNGAVLLKCKISWLSEFKKDQKFKFDIHFNFRNSSYQSKLILLLKQAHWGNAINVLKYLNRYLTFKV